MQLDAVKGPAERQLPIGTAAGSEIVVRGLTIRQRLIVLVLAVAIPLVLSSAAIVWRLAANARETERQDITYSVRAISSAVDARLRRYVDLANVLATTKALATDDIARFGEVAGRALQNYPGGVWVALTDPNGRQLFNSFKRAGEALQQTSAAGLALIERAAKSKQMEISGVYVGATTGVPVISLAAPVIRDGEPRYFVFVVFSPDIFLDLLNRQGIPEGWLAGVIDRRGNFIARSLDQARRVGTPASPGWRAVMDKEGWFEFPTLEGEPSVIANVVSHLSGWAVALAARKDLAEAPIRRIMLWGGLAGGAVTLLSILLTAWAARKIATPIATLGAAAQALQRHETVDFSPTGVPEVDQAMRAFDGASKAVIAHDEQQRDLNERLEQRVRERTAALEAEGARRAEAEARLRQAQKMEAVGHLSGGIAHDFNNLLMAVLGSLEILRKHLSPDDRRAERLLDNAVQGARRGAVLTQRLLAFGRRQTLQPEPVDLPALVRGMSGLLRSSVGAGVQVGMHFPIDLAAALVDANQLELALLNLAANARDAMAGSGRLTIAAREEAEGADAAAGAYVVLSIADTGAGMDDATLARATEPFFTTKGLGKGTGLGLSMVHGLAAQSGGKLVLHSVPGQGTTAELWLPRADTAGPLPATAAAAAAAPRPDPIRRRTVLVVDDDPLVLASTAAMLEDMGHTAVEAASGRQALEVLRRGSGMDLVVTDQSMPGMTGIQLAAELRRLRPGLPVLLATGYAERVEVVASGLPALAKPFNQAALAAAIGKCLTAPAGEGQAVPG